MLILPYLYGVKLTCHWRNQSDGAFAFYLKMGFPQNQIIHVCVTSNDFCIILLDFTLFFILKGTFNDDESCFLLYKVNILIK